MSTRKTKVAVVIVTVLAVGVFSWTVVHAFFYAPDTEVRVPTSTERVAHTVSNMAHNVPARLSIPSLQIDAAVQSVGVNTKGNMASPSNFTDVGWYRYGPAPGQRGSAVIDGHVDNGLRLPGVFKRLNEIKVGDDIFIDTKSGARLRFEVVEVQSYSYKDVPVERLFAHTDAARLNLVTCEGDWIKSDKTYDRRLVVYTVLR